MVLAKTRMMVPRPPEASLQPLSPQLHSAPCLVFKADWGMYGSWQFVDLLSSALMYPVFGCPEAARFAALAWSADETNDFAEVSWPCCLQLRSQCWTSTSKQRIPFWCWCVRLESHSRFQFYHQPTYASGCWPACFGCWSNRSCGSQAATSSLAGSAHLRTALVDSVW